MNLGFARKDRIFCKSDALRDDPEWYFKARGGIEFGPFTDKKVAEEHLDIFIADCQRRNDKGGR